MPEGPELAKSRDHLRKYVGHTIVTATISSGRYTAENLVGYKEWTAGRTPLNDTLLEVDVKGKFMWWRFKDDWYMWCTYGMSGQWMRELTKHCALFMHVQNPSGVNSWLAFNDQRHFGTLKFVKGREALDKKLASLGPDMLNAPPDEQAFRTAMRRRNNKTLAEALMDQSCVSGVGNYIKAEALYLAELSPHREVSSLSGTDMEHLRKQIINVMRASYNNDGATIRSYLNVDGTKGGMKSRFLVYDNQTDPLGNPVVKEETKDGRTTHWVPAIQK